jgi:soluble lytic murein transglycosylase-like protein
MKQFLLTAAILGVCAVPARAELVFFNTGRNLSVQSHHVDGDTIVMEMRGGGEMSCAASLVSHIDPDEVPYPQAAVVPAKNLAIAPATPIAIPTPTVRLETHPRFDPIIQKVAKEQGVDATLVRAVIQVESGYEPRARSSSGAMGLMQVMPATARQYGVAPRRLYDPRANIEAGIKHLKSLLDHLPLHLALAAYNAGEGAVQRFRGVPPYPETQKYVSTILALLVQ